MTSGLTSGWTSGTTSGTTSPQQPRPSAAARPVRWAADAVATMREGARLRLDYSAQSLWRVDRMIDGIRGEEAPYAAVETALRGLGAYAGEVIVRQSGGEWWTTGGDHWVRTPDGRLWDPIDEARRCFAGDGSLRLLCRDATAPR
ncbi:MULTISPECIES: hypothetical protein [Streptomyces]|uniref:Uncharacterized protein n=4 Tax=Streptomyces TaxID=1883 RepID=A0ABT4P2N7_9ACTN|nr:MULTISPECIES: hypothetical protein [Streptomyces]MCW8118106.1 hypothetical protein [Streptomyces anthocyanicus]MCZ4635642.1 hypothetical protein [Streptomyces rubrogriseus]MDX3349765.1 hypothetical protein [Streptomyces sp. ME02-6979A]